MIGVGSAQPNERFIGRPLTPNQQIVYRAIEGAAAAGQYCPTNEDLADALGASSQATAGYAIRTLESFGLIAIERVGRGRRIRLTATGQVTK